jgi:hypothetical protein
MTKRNSQISSDSNPHEVGNKQASSNNDCFRMSLWYDDKACGSHNMRNAICVFGLEDLAGGLRLANIPHLFANKFYPEFDFGAAVCWLETMFNRTHLEDQPTVTDADGVVHRRGLARVEAHRQFYTDLPHVRSSPLTITIFKIFCLGTLPAFPQDTGPRPRKTRSGDHKSDSNL